MSLEERLTRSLKYLRAQLEESQERIQELEFLLKEEQMLRLDSSQQRHSQLLAAAELARQVQRQQRELRLAHEENERLRRELSRRREFPPPAPPHVSAPDHVTPQLTAPAKKKKAPAEKPLTLSTYPASAQKRARAAPPTLPTPRRKR